MFNSRARRVFVPVLPFCGLLALHAQENSPAPADAVPATTLQEPPPQPPTVGTPDRAEAWKGLVTSLHQGGQDRDALAQAQKIPPPVALYLQRDPDYLANLAAIYNGLGDGANALSYLNQAEGRYMASGKELPVGLEVSKAYLLLNSHNYTELHSALIELGSRSDLTDEQRAGIAEVWAIFAVQRAAQETKAGHARSALTILLTAHNTYPENATVTRSLAGSYLGNGDAKTSIALYKTAGLENATAGDYQGAVGAALATNDMADAVNWTRSLLQAAPQDPQVLTLAAKVLQTSGNRADAALYYKEALRLMPAPQPKLSVPMGLRDRPVIAGLAKTTPTLTLGDVLSPGAVLNGTPGGAAATAIYLPGQERAAPAVPVVMPDASTAAVAYTTTYAAPPSTSTRPVAHYASATTTGPRGKRLRKTIVSPVKADAAPEPVVTLGNYQPGR